MKLQVGCSQELVLAPAGANGMAKRFTELATLNEERPPHGKPGQNIFHDRPVDIGQPIVASLEPVGQPLVVNPQQVQQRGIQVVHMDRIADNIEAQFIGFAPEQAVDMSPPVVPASQGLPIPPALKR